MKPELIDVPPGLAGVVVAETALGDVRGLEGFYHYREYSAVELAEQRGFEDVWFLMYYGHLPSIDERAVFDAELRAARQLPPAVIDLLPQIAAATRNSDPLSGLRATLSLLAGVEGFGALYDHDQETRLRQAIMISAATPVVLIMLHRLRNGLPMVEPVEDDDHVGHY